MHRIDADGNVNGMFFDGEPNNSILGTKVDAAWLNSVQEELVALVLNHGTYLSKSTNNELWSLLDQRLVRARGLVHVYNEGIVSADGVNIASASVADAVVSVNFFKPLAAPTPPTNPKYTVLCTLSESSDPTVDRCVSYHTSRWGDRCDFEFLKNDGSQLASTSGIELFFDFAIFGELAAIS